MRIITYLKLKKLERDIMKITTKPDLLIDNINKQKILTRKLYGQLNLGEFD